MWTNQTNENNNLKIEKKTVKNETELHLQACVNKFVWKIFKQKISHLKYNNLKNQDLTEC